MMDTKKRRRRFIPEECNHVYQKTSDDVILFYDREDYLVCYMILSVIAKKHKIVLLEMCFMIDHIHLLLEAETREVMADFVRDYSSVFAHEYNVAVGRSGKVFHKSYGNAPKKGDKKMRSTIVYIGNNPVEKKLCKKAEEYRWNFLKYMVDKNPFSLKTGKCSRALLRLIRQVKEAASSGIYLNYTRIRSMMSKVSEDEQEVLADYIINVYYPFDDERVLAYYESWRQMTEAMHSTAGSEYDIKERFCQGSDQVYVDMIKLVKEELGIVPVRSVTALPVEQKERLAVILHEKCRASYYQICRFLQIKKKS